MKSIVDVKKTEVGDKGATQIMPRLND